MKKNIKVIHLSFVDKNLSGGDKIFLEYFRHINFRKFTIEILTNEYGHLIYENYLPKKYFEKITFNVIKNRSLLKIGINFSYPLRILNNLIHTLFFKSSNSDIIISTSDFLTDVIPAIILKKRQSNKSILIFSFFLKAPNPFHKNFPYTGLNYISGFFYWATQYFSVFLINTFNEGLIICSKTVKKILKSKNYLYIPGGVNFKNINSSKSIKKIYDSCYYARFHPQKGPDEALYIWNILVRKYNSNAKLVMIGDGPLYNKCVDIILKLKLDKNVILKGYMHDVSKKKRIFTKTKILLHPAIYDTGGMAALECMSYGIPAISYDLKGLKETYPIGMKKIKPFNREYFAKSINELLENKYNNYNSLKKETIKLSKDWDWKKRYREFEEYLSF